jgi:signal transduction histidine kinase
MAVLQKHWIDAAIAVVATIAAVIFAYQGYLYTAHPLIAVPPGMPIPPTGGTPPPGVEDMVWVVLTTLPLAFRRKYPVSVFCVIMAAVLAGNQHLTAISIAAVLFAAYSAVVYSSKQWVALGCLVAGLLVITFAYPKATPSIPTVFAPSLLLLPTIALGYLARMWQLRAGESASRLERADAKHEAATAHALELERARIASELHDVVTHNVSVMVVQAGAARQVLGRSPADVREALLAIEASGRNAMTELRHLLSLLAPDRTGEELRPQPGLDEIPGLVAGVQSAGLTVELTVNGTPTPLPPGLDLAAYRVVQEALTNIIKHAGQARTYILITWTAELEITVSNDGTVGTHGEPGSGGVYGGSPYGGRGLIGLRERVAIYGGSLDAGPRPGGGWRVRACFPLERAIELRMPA